ncbi:hypothetical protein GCM10010123_09690 [Pilimelia anulata]|uniref:Uncharacterized protein n=1 Tax=Pilimelia anulata TaxID=53371 RepID=A0A8J3B0S3_9ACTN|nr:hypothetical protein GCM10010123_09690 [Pilimelia anulata]
MAVYATVCVVAAAAPVATRTPEPSRPVVARTPTAARRVIRRVFRNRVVVRWVTKSPSHVMQPRYRTATTYDSPGCGEPPGSRRVAKRE